MTVRRRGSFTTIFTVAILILVHPVTAWLQEPAPAGSAQRPNAVEQQPQAPGVLSVPGTTTKTDDTTGREPDEADAAGKGAESARQADYVIKEQDTLWDIAAAHFQDPFLWPLLWQANPSVKNPDLIYPGMQLVIPSLAPIERAMSAPQEPKQLEEKPEIEKPAAPKKPEVPSFFRKETVQSTVPEPKEPEQQGTKLVLPEETVPPIVDKFMMLSAGFISEEESKDYIIGSADDPEKSILSHDETVYISVHSETGVKAGDRFLIYQAVHKVKHPVTKRRYGVLYRVIGILKVVKANEEGSTTATASIIKSFDAAERGSLLTPYQEPTLLYPASARPSKNLTGHLLETVDRRSINAQSDFVFLDKGMDDGVDPGDRFIVYADGGNGSGMSKALGEIEVFIVKQRTATAIVRKSVDAMSKGDRYSYKN